jgi:hypothetical protein
VKVEPPSEALVTHLEGPKSNPGVRRRLRLILGLRLLERLANDAAAEGSRFPSIRAIAAASGVHRNTAAAVVADLAGFGLLTCVVGSGSHISRPPSALEGAVPLACEDPVLAQLLGEELGRPVAVGPEPPTGGLLLRPLHLPPLHSARCIPVAPAGNAVAAIRSLRPGSLAVVSSHSSAVRILLGQVLGALHGDRVSVIELAACGEGMPLLRSPLRCRPTTVFHDPGRPPRDRTVSACPVYMAPPKPVDTG